MKEESGKEGWRDGEREWKGGMEGWRKRVERRDGGMEEESGKEGWSRDEGRECKEQMEQGWRESEKDMEEES
jgi:hypothetical protein